LPSFDEECRDDTRHHVGGAPSIQTSLDLPLQIASLRKQTHPPFALAASVGLKQQRGIDTVVLLNWIVSKKELPGEALKTKGKPRRLRMRRRNRTHLLGPYVSRPRDLLYDKIR
jgi:hypothetical protein